MSSALALEDIARVYEGWEDRGPERDGRRLTLMALQTSVPVGEAVEVLHVYEVLDGDHRLHVMGPKPVYGERLDGRAATAPEPPAGDDPFAPGLYDGRVLPGPGIDCNFETTSYSFSSPGRHEVTWEIAGLRSNSLTLEAS
jgi:hypothetical protein